ncbi:MAG: response regulator transcription factor [Anaerolineae bacterium]|nr:response regulator transcription factor [Anaerolineae bacterium]
MMHRILVVDDDAQMLTLITQLLEREGYVVQTALSGEQVLEMIEDDIPDMFIVDCVLPGMDGLKLCRHLRKNSRVAHLPVIFITGNDSPTTIAEALEAGGDDFIRKPFVVREFAARLRAHLRRVEQREPKDDIPTIRIYPDVRTVMVDDRQVDLTQVEYELLRYLCHAPAKLHSTQDLLINVWQYPPDAGDTALVRNHIRNLRRKLEDSPERPEIIQSRHGRGYTIKARVQLLDRMAMKTA